MSEPVMVPSGRTLVLTAGDLDEAISGLLTNHLVASDANGDTVPAGSGRGQTLPGLVIDLDASIVICHRPPIVLREAPGPGPCDVAVGPDEQFRAVVGTG